MVNKHMRRWSTSLIIKDMQSKPQWGTTSHLLRWWLLKTSDNNCWQGCGEIGTLVHCCWEYKMVQSLWKTTCSTSKIKHRITMWFTNSTSGYLPKRIESQVPKRYLHTHVHSSIIHSSQKVKATQCPLIDECINKTLSIHAMEYYPALKREETLIHAATWMNLEDIVLR